VGGCLFLSAVLRLGARIPHTQQLHHHQVTTATATVTIHDNLDGYLIPDHTSHAATTFCSTASKPTAPTRNPHVFNLYHLRNPHNTRVHRGIRSRLCHHNQQQLPSNGFSCDI